jgi:protein N-terminal glutamine amidohydrolase
VLCSGAFGPLAADPSIGLVSWLAQRRAVSLTTFTPVPYYCEENVWQLCAEPQVEGSPKAALVISNTLRQVAVAHQRAARDPSLVVVWDYHVVLAAHAEAGWVIWDVDSTLGLPVPLSLYLRASFGYPEGFAEPHAARFRIIEASRYRATLATDRSHMRAASGQLRAPAPPWPPIGEGTNLMRLVDMDDDLVGEVVSLRELPAALDRLGP